MEALHVLFFEFMPFIHPSDARSLSLVSCDLHRTVEDGYQRFGRFMVTAPHGPWHRLPSKRTRDNIGRTMANHRPPAIASLIDRACIACGQRFLGAPDVWGFLAHPACIRPFMINTYYLPHRFGILEAHVDALPHAELEGYRPHHRCTYTYHVVWKNPWKGMVPPPWTLKHFLENAPEVVRIAIERKRHAEEELRAAEEESKRRRSDLETRRSEKRQHRLRKLLQKDPAAEGVVEALRLNGHVNITGDYLDNKLTARTKLAEVLENVDKARAQMASLHPTDVHDIGGDRRQGGT